MKKQIRKNVFETNSSSTHSLTICSKEEFDTWERGEILFDEWHETFIPIPELSEEVKEETKDWYMENKVKYKKDWDDLSDKEKQEICLEYAMRNGIVESGETYEDYMDDNSLEIFEETYTTKSGDEIVAFGKYGYDS